MSDSEEDGNEQYEDAICPDCGVVLTGSREPGDMDTCQDSGKPIKLQEYRELEEIIDGDFVVESPYGETPKDDVACADCGAYRELVGPLNFAGEVAEEGDFVCRRCARKRSLPPEKEP